MKEQILNSKSLECAVCQRKFAHYSGKHRHQATCGKNVKYECTYCSKKYSRSDGLRNHVKQVHESTEDQQTTQSNINNATAVYQYQPRKKQQFRRNGSLQRYIKPRHEDACEMIDKSTQTTEKIYAHPLSIESEAHEGAQGKFNCLNVSQPRVFDFNKFGRFRIY